MPNRIRVLFAIGSLDGGGSERQIVTILRHLDRARFSPMLYLIRRSGEFSNDVPSDVPVFAFDDRHSAPRRSLPGTVHRMQVRDLAQTLAEQRVDVIYDRTYHMTLIAAPAARRAGTARISVIVSDPRQDLTNNERRFRSLKRWLLRKAYAQANRTVAVSEGTRAAAIDYYRLPENRVITLPNLLDLERIRSSANAFDPAFESNRFHIVTAGRLDGPKGYRFLLSAIEELVNSRGVTQFMLHILGKGPLENELRAFVRDHGLGAHVRFEGYVANPFPFFRAAQLFVLPSLCEGMPNVLLEAIACGLPIVSTDCPSGPRELLAAGTYGALVPPGDAVQLAGAIEEAINDYDARKEIAAAARIYAEEQYSVPKGIARLEEVIENIR